jgi:SAM-dependent methyltransferase
MAGWLVASAPEPRPSVLDLCTGTGLTVVEMVKVLRLHGRQAAITAVDYNEAMLRHARARFATIPDGLAVTFERGDATALTGSMSGEFATLPRNSFDIVTQVFGIGGIGDPVAVFRSVLTVLREGGRFLLIDMHRPITELPGEWPVPGAWINYPRWEAFTYLNTTMPLVLARLWGWRDTTLDFYLAPLMCEEADGTCYGFRVVWKYMESERWWLALPVMPTCRLLLEKVRIDRTEYDRRQQIMRLIGASR